MSNKYWTHIKFRFRFLANPWFHGAMAAIGLVWMVLPSDAAKEIKAARISAKCREMRQIAALPVAFLRDFLLDPHVENLGWEFHNNLTGLTGPGSPLRSLLNELPLKTSLCDSQSDLLNQYQAQLHDAGSIGRYFPVARGVTASPEIKIATTDGLNSENSQNDLDCFISRARELALLVDRSGSPAVAADLNINGGNLLRDKNGLILPYVCKETIADSYCDIFQEYTNYLIAGASDILQAIVAFEKNCEQE